MNVKAYVQKEKKSVASGMKCRLVLFMKKRKGQNQSAQIINEKRFEKQKKKIEWSDVYNAKI